MRKIFQRISPATLFLISLSAIGAFLRWKGLTFQSLWLDEIHTMLEAKPQYSLSEIVSFLSNTDPHPPFYFFLVHYWFEIFGYSDFSGRLLSMIVGTLTIPAAYFLGRELYSRSAGLICATFTAFNFYNIYYSQETRGYIFVFFLACLSFLYFVRALRAPDIRSAGAYVLVTVLLVYTHYFGLILLVSQGLIFVIALIEENARKRRSKSLRAHFWPFCCFISHGCQSCGSFLNVTLSGFPRRERIFSSHTFGIILAKMH